MTDQEKIAVCILCDEAASLFEGGEDLPRFGGAGLHMYLLGQGLAQNPRYEVSFVLNYTSADTLSDPNISFIDLRKHRHSILSRLKGAGTPRAYDHLPKKRVFITTMADFAPQMLREAGRAGAPTIFQTACEHDVTHPYERSEEDGAALIDDIASCDEVFVQSETQQRNLLESRNKQSQVVHKGWPLPDKLPGMEEKKGILWVGSAQMVKQPWVLFDVARLMPDQPFTAIMPPADKQVTDYAHRQVRELDNVTLIDTQVSYPRIQDYFDKALIYLFTSEFEDAASLTIIQAAAGGAAIVSERMNPDGMLDEDRCGIHAGVGADSVVAAIRRVLADDELRSSMIENAFAFVQKNFSFKDMIDIYTKTIDALVEDAL
ncbi:MAG: glycosyltransferase [Actinomycetia bacterium]|nr:glycosyltransferase [Actinomycetes bacterium]